MTRNVELRLSDGRVSHARFWAPPAKADSPPPLVLVVHEWWGLTDAMTPFAERLVGEGFAACAMDLYFGESTSDEAKALELVMAMDTKTSMALVAEACRVLAPSVGRVGILGFCVGGAMSIAAACTVPGISAAVPFYGIPREAFLQFGPSTPPIQGHYGQHDGSIPVARARALRDAAHAAGAKFDLHTYDAGHAFLREGDPAHYVQSEASLAWKRAMAFLHTELDAPARR